MSPEITTELKIPDLWFDFYARFLPGTLFVSAVYLIFPRNGNIPIPSGWLIAILALSGYCAGLLVQPISSEIVGFLHGIISRAATGDWDFVNMQKHHDPLRILSKMHGETTFFVQCVVLSIVLLILQKMSSLQLRSTPKTINATIFFLIFSIVMAALFAWRRVRRAKRLKRIADRMGNIQYG